MFTENAKDIVTAKGSPSGTATTIIVTAVINAFTKYYKVSIHKKQCSPLYISIDKLTNNANIVKPAAIVPAIPFFYFYLKLK